MVTMVSSGRVNNYYGLSTDEMPTVRVPNGSMFYVFDTTEVFVFDQENQEWIKQSGGT